MSRLFLRIFLWFWLASTSLVIVLAASLVMMQPDVVTTWRFIGRSAMRPLGAEVANAFEQGGAARAAEIVNAVSREGRFRVWVYTADAQLVAGPSAVENVAEIVTRSLAGEDVERSQSAGLTLLARRTASQSGTPYVVMWEAPRWWAAQASPVRFALRVLALALTAGVVCWWLTWQITKPVRTLRAAARRVGEGDLSARVSNAPELRRRDELSDLAQEFDRMASRVEELLTSQERLLVDISHELRSPLARLSLALDLARRRFGNDAPEHMRIEREIRRLDELIGRILTLARLRAEERPSRSETIDLHALVRDVVQDARFEATAAGVDVVMTGACEATLQGSRPLLTGAVENVIRNAIRYAPVDTAVEVSVACDDGARRASIVVRDRGPGVPDEALPKLFEPFFRVDGARDRGSGGLGLGLAITRDAMRAHRGDASAEKRQGGGLQVRLELPIDR